MMGLEEEVHTLGRKLSASEEELAHFRNECSSLRYKQEQLAYMCPYKGFVSLVLWILINLCVCECTRLENTQVESCLSENQRRLTSRIGDLQNAQERNQIMDEKNSEKNRQYI